MSRSKISLAPEGGWIIAISAVTVVIAVVISLLSKSDPGFNPGWLWLTVAASIWFLIVLNFFRDPKRTSPEGNNIVVSPADGKVIRQLTDASDSPLTPAGKLVSIFMSPLNVHVNRAPFSGRIASVEHRNGRFKSAFKDAASRENEHVEVIMDVWHGLLVTHDKLAFRQVAGFLARRIVFHPKPGDMLLTGERVGMIRFGSRVDLYLPDNVILKTKVGDRVVAGETIIGEFI